ncbi:MFS transporter [Actinoplanes sp. NPDC023801]|uniref:MFS transporter n=1 Tax=Actinoplanes sp. NPDC023801 TaxID=3154595 RepID=UPI0033DBB888
MRQSADMRTRPASLLRQRKFALLWAGQSASVFGTEITFVAVPLTAVLVLDATPMEAGVLRALETVPFLLFGLFVGVLLDRRARRSVMIVADVVRAAALAWIPIAYALDVLTIAQLFVVVFVLGVMTVFFDLAYQSYLPGLVGRDRLTEANGKLQLSASGAQVAGPGAAGLLIAWLGAPVALAVDAMTYVISFFTVARLPADEVAKAQPDVPAASVGAAIREGISVLWRHPLLRWCTTAAVIINLFSAVVMSLFFLFLVQEVGIGAAQVGLVVAAGSVGALAGSMMVGRLSRWFGDGPAIIVSMALSTLGYLLVALAPAKSSAAFAVAALGSFIALFGVPVFNVLVVSLRQISTPDELLGRVNATARTCIWGAASAGALLGGAFASVAGLREAVLVGAAGTFLAALVLLFSPVRAVRDLHATATGHGPAAEPRTGPTDQEQTP